jgi:hypothetical protein
MAGCADYYMLRYWHEVMGMPLNLKPPSWTPEWRARITEYFNLKRQNEDIQLKSMCDRSAAYEALADVETKKRRAAEAEVADLKRKLEALERPGGAKRQKTAHDAVALGTPQASPTGASESAAAASTAVRTPISTTAAAAATPVPMDADVKDDADAAIIRLRRASNGSLSVSPRASPSPSLDTGGSGADEKRPREEAPFVSFEESRAAMLKAQDWIYKNHPKVRVHGSETLPTAMHWALGYLDTLTAPMKLSVFRNKVWALRNGPSAQVDTAISKLRHRGMLELTVDAQGISWVKPPPVLQPTVLTDRGGSSFAAFEPVRASQPTPLTAAAAATAPTPTTTAAAPTAPAPPATTEQKQPTPMETTPVTTSAVNDIDGDATESDDDARPVPSVMAPAVAPPPPPSPVLAPNQPAIVAPAAARDQTPQQPTVSTATPVVAAPVPSTASFADSTPMQVEIKSTEPTPTVATTTTTTAVPVQSQVPAVSSLAVCSSLVVVLLSLIVCMHTPGSCQSCTTACCCCTANTGHYASTTGRTFVDEPPPHASPAGGPCSW